MKTKDLKRVDKLVQVADMAVRVASQLRLWRIRNCIGDRDSIDRGVQFLEEAVQGGRFIAFGEPFVGTSSLYPLTWSADVRFRRYDSLSDVEHSPTNYDDLVCYLNTIKSTLITLANNDKPTDTEVDGAARFFDQLGAIVGRSADSALNHPTARTSIPKNHAQ
jgi:hypothetical protein